MTLIVVDHYINHDRAEGEREEENRQRKTAELPESCHQADEITNTDREGQEDQSGNQNQEPIRH